MIEICTAQNGEKILRYDGKLLASRFDPTREAREWVQSRREFLDKVATVFVLGMGSGQHVHELLRSTPARLIVLEASEDIIATELNDFPAGRISIYHVPNGRALRKIDAVKSAVARSFVVFSHAPSQALFPKIYQECRAQLIARDWGNLNWQWKLRSGPAFDSNPRIDGTSQLLSIHDLEQTELVQNSEEREKLLFLALRDLVK